MSGLAYTDLAWPHGYFSVSLNLIKLERPSSASIINKPSVMFLPRPLSSLFWALWYTRGLDHTKPRDRGKPGADDTPCRVSRVCPSHQQPEMEHWRARCIGRERRSGRRATTQRKLARRRLSRESYRQHSNELASLGDLLARQLFHLGSEPCFRLTPSGAMVQRRA